MVKTRLRAFSHGGLADAHVQDFVVDFILVSYQLGMFLDLPGQSEGTNR